MKTIPEKLRKNGFSYSQIIRGTRAAIFEQNVSPEIKYFEVFIIKIKPRLEINGKVIEEREAFPKNEDFGRSAWSYANYEDAKKKYDELEKKSDIEKL